MTTPTPHDSQARPGSRTIVLAIVAIVIAAGVMLAIDTAAGGKHPVTITVVAFGGALLLIGVALLIPGGLLARPEGTRAGELGIAGDRAVSLDAADATSAANIDSSASTNGDADTDTDTSGDHDG